MRTPPFHLYQRYSCQDIRRHALMGGTGRSLLDGHWLVCPDFAACCAEIGAMPASTFLNAGRFQWRTSMEDGQIEDTVSDNPAYRMSWRHVPTEVRSGQALGAILLFIRKPGQDDYLYIGLLQPCFHFGGKQGAWFADFDLVQALPTRVWQDVMGDMPEADDAALDLALDRLRVSTDTDTRFAVLQALAMYWHGPVAAQPAPMPEEPMPDVLRRWYRWAGPKSPILSGQNELLPPERLKIEDGRLVFYGENQWCYAWSTLPDGIDPPVYGRQDDREPWQLEGMALSEHIILACLFEIIVGHAPFGAHAPHVDYAQLAQLETELPAVAIAPWRWCIATRFYVGKGAFMVVMDLGEDRTQSGACVFIGAKTAEALAFLQNHPDIAWDHKAL